MSAPKVVETRTLTVSHDIKANVYDDGTVGTPDWARRDANGWMRVVEDKNKIFPPASSAEAKALYELALEVAPKPEEPTRFGFVGTVTTPEGVVYDVTCALNAEYHRVYTVYSRGKGVIEGGKSWDRILDHGTFTPRGDA